MAERLSVGMLTSGMAPMRLERLSHHLYRLMGVDSLFVQDHLMGFAPRAQWTPDHTPAARIVPSPHGFFDPFSLLGSMASSGRRTRLGVAVSESFRRHPAVLAQAAVTLDHLTGGRFVLGIGSGERENTEPYGLPFTGRLRRCEEALTVLRLLWDSGGAPVSFAGRIFSLHDAVFDTPLFRDRPPRLWIAAHGPRMLELTGRFGDGWLPTHKLTPAQYADSLAVIRAAAGRAGRRPSGFEPALQILVALGRDRRTVLKRLISTPIAGSLALLMPGELWRRHDRRHPMGETFAGFSDLVPERVTDQQIAMARQSLTPELIGDAIFAGSVDEIVDEITPLVHAGLRHVIVWNVGPLADGVDAAGTARMARLVRRLRRICLPTPAGFPLTDREPARARVRLAA